MTTYMDFLVPGKLYKIKQRKWFGIVDEKTNKYISQQGDIILYIGAEPDDGSVKYSFLCLDKTICLWDHNHKTKSDLNYRHKIILNCYRND